ncbi:hypothetical protein D3C85_1480290 [compost metagenome]
MFLKATPGFNAASAVLKAFKTTAYNSSCSGLNRFPTGNERVKSDAYPSAVSTPESFSNISPAFIL